MGSRLRDQGSTGQGRRRPGVVDAQGLKLNTDGTCGGGTMAKSVRFKSKPPADAVVKFYLITKELVVAVPFARKDLPAPVK